MKNAHGLIWAVIASVAIVLLIVGCQTHSNGSTSTAASPTFSIAEGTYDSFQIVTLSSSTGGAAIYYTLDGTTPSTSSSAYSGEIVVTSTETIKATAIKSGWHNSAVASASYTIDHYTNGSDSTGKPCYWKNGSKTLLSIPSSALGGSATQRVSWTSALYFAGYSYVSSSDQYTYQPCSWAGGTRTDLELPSGATGGEPMYLTVSGSDVLVSGLVYFSSSTWRPCYWKNGACTLLNSSFRGNAFFLANVDSSIYTCGWISVNNVTTPCYWKDGVPTTLPFSSSRSGAGLYRMVIENGALYFCGYSFINSTNGFTPCYWGPDGACTELSFVSSSSSTDGAWPSAIFISGSDVYIGGHSMASDDSNSPCYWKNGSYAELSMPSSATGCSVWWFQAVNGNTYVRGSWWDGSGDEECYWLNDVYNGGTYYPNGSRKALEAGAVLDEGLLMRDSLLRADAR